MRCACDDTFCEDIIESQYGKSIMGHVTLIC